MSAPPYMPLWIADFQADTVHLRGHEAGAYLLLLMAMWRAGGYLKGDDASLARYSKLTSAQWARVSDSVLPFFIDADDGMITHKRVQSELQKCGVALEKRKERASKGGIAKALKNKETVLPQAKTSKREALLKPAIQSQSQSQSQNISSDEDIDSIFFGVPPALPAVVVPEPPKPEKAEARATAWNRAAMPDLNPEWRAEAIKIGLDNRMADDQFSRFSDFWSAKGGQNGRKKDWLATWRNWCRNAYDRHPAAANRNARHERIGNMLSGAVTAIDGRIR